MNNWPSYLPTSMTYDDFLTDFQFEDSPEARQAFEQTFNLKSGVDHVPLKNFGFSPGPVELADRGFHGRLMSDNKVLYDTTGQEGRNFLKATDRFHNRDNWNQSDVYPGFVEPPSGRYVDLHPDVHDPFTPGLITPGPQDPTVLSAPEGYFNRNSLLAPTNVTGPTGTAGPLDATALTPDPSLYGGSESALASATTEAGLEAGVDSASGLSGPQSFAVNMALNMIPTRDRKKQSTPFGDEGSASGILKGAGKGALLGSQIDVATGGSTLGTGALIGGTLGAIGGAQGYFDSTSAPTISMSRIKRGGGGMQGGLLGGGMYG